MNLPQLSRLPVIWRRFVYSVPPQAVLAGLITTIVMFAGPMTLVFQAAQVAQLGVDATASWVFAIAFFSGVGSVYLSWRYKMPLLMAMNTPVAALLVSTISPTNYQAMIGAFCIAGLVVWLMGVFGWFKLIAQYIPQGIVGALLAGVLFRFAADLFIGLSADIFLVGGVFLAFVLSRRYFPTYAVLNAFVVGVFLVAIQGRLSSQHLVFEWPHLVLTKPEFTVEALVSLSLPFIALSLCGQYMPGLALLKANRYQPPVDPLLKVGGFLSVIAAPFGAHGINLAAVAAAMSVEPHAHRNRRRRFLAGVFCGIFCMLVAMGGSTLVGFFLSLPKGLIVAISGVAMFSAIQSGVLMAFEKHQERESALITLIVAASGMKLFGLAAPFWALIFGLLVHAILSFRKKR
jgi:benzoate membrane transport protein